MPQDDLTTEAIARLLEQSGHTREEALALAREATRRSRTISKGCSYGHLHPEELADLWNTAARSGKRRLVLEVSADALSHEEYDGHIHVQVLDAEEWPEVVRSEVDHMAAGEEAPDLWMPSDDETEERPRPEEMN